MGSKDKNSIRKDMRRKRRSLSRFQRGLSAVKIFKRVSAMPIYSSAASIALYFANDGEISPLPLMKDALRKGKSICLPRVKGGTLEFRKYSAFTNALALNGYGIPEPKASCSLFTLSQLDIIFVPLVAFDRYGNRLGMGAGYYDKTFSSLSSIPGRKPKLIGLAHEFQRVAEIRCDAWDIPLDAIASDQKVYYLNGGAIAV